MFDDCVTLNMKRVDLHDMELKKFFFSFSRKNG